MIEVWVLVISLFGAGMKGATIESVGSFQSEALCEDAARKYGEAFAKHDGGDIFRRVVVCVQTGFGKKP